MPLLHDTIPQFFNGVSQQAPNLRRESQVSEQINCMSSITDGVLPRPPSSHVAEISASSLGNVYLHTINRDVDTRFEVVISNGEIKVFDLDGVEQTVTYPAGTDYLVSSDPKNDFEAYTVKDYTFILNKTITTASKPKDGVELPSGLSTSSTYYVRVIDGNTIALHPTQSDAVNNTNTSTFASQGVGIISFSNPPDSSISTKDVSSTVDTSANTITLSNSTGMGGTGAVRGAMRLNHPGDDSNLPGGTSQATNYWVRNLGSNVFALFTNLSDALNNTNRVNLTSNCSSLTTLVYLGDDGIYGTETASGSDFDFINNDINIPSHDYFTGAAVTLSVSDNSILRTVQRFTDLSDVAGSDAAGNYYKVEGDEDNAFDSYYLEKTNNGSNNAADVYTEVADPTLTSNDLDETTMPHQLVRTGTNTFEFQVIPWVARVAGDENSNPFPSFVGNTIRDIFLYRNRFGLLSGDNTILSEAGGDNFFNFFRTTTTQLLDSDPIDVSANNTRVSDLKYAVPFTDSLLLFSDQTQFELGSDDLLTPSTVEIKPTTEFVASNKARPVLAGRNVYFPVERTNFTGIREYFVDANDSGNDAADVTKHVPRYIPADVFKIVPSSNDDALFLLSEQEPSAIYVYQWYWAQTQGGLNKLQSAWHKWDMGTGSEVLNIDLIDNTLYLVIEREGSTFIESIDITTRNLDTELLFQVRLDRRVNLTGSYDAGTGLTTWTLPYEASEVPTIVRGGGFSENGGLEVLNTTLATSTTVTAVGDLSEAECIVGYEYDKTMTLSPIFPRKGSQSGGSVSRLGGRLQLRKIKLSYSDSAFFTVTVTPKDRSPKSRNFSAPIGSSESVIGSLIPRDGVFSVPVISKADTTTITISSNSYLPFSITSAEWEGFFHSNAR